MAIERLCYIEKGTQHVSRTYFVCCSLGGLWLLSQLKDFLHFHNSLENNSKQFQKEYQLAMEQSYGFFDDVTREDWKRLQAWARHFPTHFHGDEDFYDRPELWYYHNMDPYFTCLHQKRVGGLGDGPKWTCDPHRLRNLAERRKVKAEFGMFSSSSSGGGGPPYCLIYSVGSGGNYQWEDNLYNMIDSPICEFHIFDFSGNFTRPENTRKNMYFHQFGLKGSTERNAGYESIQRNSRTGYVTGPEAVDRFLTFPEILKYLGHENRTIDIFKIDCEGCEYKTYQDWISHDIRQVLIATHQLPPSKKDGCEFFDSFRKNNLLMFSKEANGFSGGKWYEFSFIKLHPQFLGNSGNRTVERAR